jgi:hypothetical protein
MNMLNRKSDLTVMALGLCLSLASACDSDPPADPTESGSTGDTGDTDGTDPSTGSSTTATTEMTADSSSGDPTDPCDSCDPNATCMGETCVCNDGFEGDGTTCDDADECADATHTCSADATCTNTPGSFECECNEGFVGDGTSCDPAESCADDPCDANATCTDDNGIECMCNDGWEGDGFTCTDIDECAASPCDVNATCTNSDGDFDCMCNPDFAGDGFTCNGTLGYFDTCMVPDVCASGLCIGAPYDHCSEFCNQAIPDNCPDVGAAGFCVPIGGGDFACVGDLDTGIDGESEILSSGDSATRGINTLTDADLFHLDLPMGDFLIEVTPDPDDDIQLEFHDNIGQAIGTVNNGGDGFVEGAILTSGGGVSFVVVRNVGNSTGSYMISVSPSP